MSDVRPHHPGSLVEPSAELTDDQAARAQRQMILPGFGEIAQRRLANARVLVIGAGGLGSACVPYLAGAGVGTIGVVDNDVVELSNLHRQVLHGTKDVGRAKTASFADAVHALNPGVRLQTHQLRLNSENALRLFRDYDLVIDGSDNFPTRYLVSDASELLALPLVWGAIFQTFGQVSVAWQPHGPGYRDLFPVPPAPGDVLNCGEGGVLPSLCGTIGSLLATEALKLITGLGDPLLGRVLIYDALSARMSELPFQRHPDRQPVLELVDYEVFCAGPAELPPSIEATDLAARLRSGAKTRLLDVRTDVERSLRHIISSESLTLTDLEASEFSLQEPVILYCENGPRSIRAAQILRERGGTEAWFLAGGIRAFAAHAPDLLQSGSEPSARSAPSTNNQYLTKDEKR
ncbi:ThiF family adenylyltransferase [Leucobacter sp. W1038]|uniref:ThiF family adenylyltransferase n=1 Tax=Leucobacter sp. W1038 TaxID=3438281 RepID=UPI003D9872EA